MPMYEVEGAPNGAVVSAPSWLGALGQALSHMGLDLSELGRLQVKVDRAGVVEVFDPTQRSSFRLVPVEDLFDDSPATLSALDSPGLAPASAPPHAEAPPAPAAAPPPQVEAPPAPAAAPPALVQPPPAAAPVSRAQAPIRRPEDLELRVAELTAELDTALDEDEACSLALRGLERLLPAESGAVMLRTHRGDLCFRAAFGPAASQVLGTHLPRDAGIAGFCFLTGLAVCVDNAARDARHDDTVEQRVGYTTTSLVAAPVPGLGRERLGCLELLNAPEGFRDWQVEATQRVAQALGARLTS